MRLAPPAVALLSSPSRPLAFRNVDGHRRGIGRRSAAAALGMSSGPNVVVVGSINQDLSTYAPRLPERGETILGTDFASSPVSIFDHACLICRLFRTDAA